MRRIRILLAAFAVLPAAPPAAAGEHGIAAHVSKGEALWHDSCQAEALNGACVALTPATQATPCRDVRLPVAVVVDRKRATANQAQRHFAAAIAMWERLSEDERTPELRRAVATARFHIAEAAFEDYLAVTMPADVDYDADPDGATMLVARWLEDKSAALEDAKTEYFTVLVTGDPTWRIAALTRIGQAYSYLSYALRSAAVPASVTGGRFADDQLGAYCDELDWLVAPIDERALDAFSLCEDAPGEWGDLCEQEKRWSLLYAPTVST